MQINRYSERSKMKELKRRREVTEAIWADSFRAGDASHRAEAVRNCELPGLIRLAIRFA
jgi:hypothetical protein